MRVLLLALAVLQTCPSAAYAFWAVPALRPHTPPAGLRSGRPLLRKVGLASLRAEADTKQKWRGPGNPAAAQLQTANFGDDLIDDVLNKRFGAGEAFYGQRQSNMAKDYDAIAEEAKEIMAMREVRQGAALIIGSCRVLGGVGQWTAIKAMQKDVPVRILAADFEAAEKTFGTDGANLDIFFGDASDMDQLDNACDGAQTVVYADEGSLPFGPNSYDARLKSGLARLLEIAPRYPSIQRIVYISSAVNKGIGNGASTAMWSAEDMLRASGIPYVIVRAAEVKAVPGGSAKIEVASSYAGAMPAGTTTTAMDVADTVVTCLVMDQILAKAMARGGEVPNLPQVKSQLTVDVWNSPSEPVPADQFTGLVKAIATLPADG